MKQYLRGEEVADMLSVSKATIKRWVLQGKLPKPFRPTQRTTLFDASLVQEAIDKMAGEA